MKFIRAALLCVCAVASAELANPLGTVLSLLDELITNVKREGTLESRAYEKYKDWCQETADNAMYAVDTSTSKKTKLTAKINELSSDIDVASRKIDDLSASIAQSEAELTNATEIRDKEAAEFKTAEGELAESVDAMGRALHVLETEMAKNPASLAQVDTSNMANAVQALSLVLDAAAFSTDDQKKLVAFVQARENADADDLEFGAPAPATYKSKSGGIVEILEDMKDKADAELGDLRKAEVAAKHNYDMLKQSLDAQSAADKKNLDEQMAGRSEAKEGKADAEGELKIAVKDLANNQKQLKTVQPSCMLVAKDHEDSLASRKEELEVIEKAKRLLEKVDSGAAASFLQLGATTGLQMQTHADLAKSEVVTMVKRLAQKHGSTALAQLASRISITLKSHVRGDQFGKIKSMIKDMITKLSKESMVDAEEKAYCDEQMPKTEQKKSELEDKVEKMTSDIDTAAARSAELKEDVKVLEAELAKLTKEQAEMDKIRQEESAAYTTTKDELDRALSGVRKALDVLKDYYGSASFVQDSKSEDVALDQQPPVPRHQHAKRGGAGNAIITILENIESDFATNLAKVEAEEADEQDAYEKTSMENKLSKSSKTEDVKYKTQEAKSLDTDMAELMSDRETTNNELSAVLEYYAKVKDRCVAKPESFEVRKQRRDDEIAGLKEALDILKNEAAFVQRKRSGSFRGSALSVE